MLAQYPPSPSETPLFPPTAPTGFDATGEWMLPAIAILLVVGLVALFIARRRAS